MSDKDFDSMQNFSSLECWDYSIELECLRGTEDLQLAAELGKTLLERNKELENSLKQHQNIIDDQTQEIEYLTKQTVALREVNDSRLRIYEQLEVSIQDLERANHRLAQENASYKKQIKNSTATIDSLEGRLEESQTTIEELKVQLDTLNRKIQRTPLFSEQIHSTPKLRRNDEEDFGVDELDRPVSPDSSTVHTEKESCNSVTRQLDETSGPKSLLNFAIEDDIPQIELFDEQIAQLLSQLRDSRTLYAREHEKVRDLEEQLTCLVQQNQTLEKQLVQIHSRDEDVKSMHEELTSLEEVRRGTMCSKCLGGRTVDNMSYGDEDPEDDDVSMLEALTSRSQHRSSFSMDVQDNSGKIQSPPFEGGNVYRDLVEKYEALLEVQRNQATRNHKIGNYVQHQEDIHISDDFNHLHTKDTDEESGHGDSLQTVKENKKNRKTFSRRTPTDFSEAETSSSGFSDETSNKGTQTEGRAGSFLCAIADGEDCKFSIYDEASPIDSRFRNRPEYRELFKEIFTVLKKAAENKDEGEALPLLDDHTAVRNVPNVPPVTPATEDFPDFLDNLTDDTQSVLSSTMSELSTTQIEHTAIENVENIEPQTAVTEEIPMIQTKKEERVLMPYVRQPLEYLTVGVNVRKRSSSRRKKQFTDRAESPITPILGSPKITYTNRAAAGRRRRDLKNNLEPNAAWNGSTLHFYSRNASSPTPSQGSGKFEYKPSTASQDLFKLKHLDLSYAEVLRNADDRKRERETYTRQRRKH